MTGFATPRSLRARILLMVVACAVLPLAAVGTWLTSTAARSGELMLRSQLDSIADRAVANIAERWSYRRSDALLLASNEPVRSALRGPVEGTAPPPFLLRAFASTPAISAFVVRDNAGRVVWTLGDDVALTSPRRPGGVSSGQSAPRLLVRLPVTDDSTGTVLGEAESYVRLDQLLGASPMGRDPVGELVAIRDRSGGAWSAEDGPSAALLDDRRFEWEGNRWLSVRRALDVPAVDVIVAGRLDPYVAPFARTARIGTAAIAIVSIAVVLLTIVVSGRLTASLSRLSLAADAVALGRFDVRADDASADEVGRVGRAFNTMTGSVQSMMRERSQREAVAAMSELAATLAHQLRSPATAIRLDVQRAHDRTPAASEAHGLLARALEQLDRMERAIAGSLRVARSAGGEIRELDVREPLRRAVEGLRREGLAGVEIDASGIAQDALHVRGETASLEQLFSNVLTNAVQATMGTGRVAISASTRDGVADVRIRDDGKGMDSVTLAQAGTPLFSTKPEGTGLGLAIARRIAAAHGGTIRIASEVDQGTVVTIALPCA